MSEEYDLKKSIEKFGVLVPIIKDQNGNTLDGLHRLELDGNAPIHIIPAKDAAQRAMIRLVINLDRRKLTKQEKNMLLGEIADSFRDKDGKVDSEGIAEALGKPANWVWEYLPEQYKDQTKVEAGRLGGEARSNLLGDAKQTVTTSDTYHPTNDLVSCDNCKMATHISRMKTLGDQDLCPLCFERLSKLPKVPEKPVTVYDSEKPKETWEQRKAQMSPQHSKIEDALRVKFSEAGIECETDRVFCLQSTTPDFYFHSKNLAVYVDGEVHNGKQDRDEALRELLTKRHGIKTVSIPYKAFTKEETNRVFNLISEEVKA